MNCPSCGRAIANDSVFCNYCGRRIEATLVDRVYIVRSCFLSNQRGFPEDRSYSSVSYYLGYTFRELKASFLGAHGMALRRAGVRFDGSNVQVGEICERFMEEHSENEINSIMNTILYWDSITSTPRGGTLYQRKELTYAKLTPPLSVQPGRSLHNRHLFEFEEYVVLDDSESNHRGYVNVSEFYSSIDSAMNRIQEEYSHYSSLSGYQVVNIQDNRSTWLSEFDDCSNYNSVYWFSVQKDGHIVRHFSINAALSSDQCSGLEMVNV